MSKNLHELTDLQLAIMKEIWSRGTATVTDVHEALLDSTGLAKKTVGTMLARLEKQGFLAHYIEGREFIYEPKVTRDEGGGGEKEEKERTPPHTSRLSRWCAPHRP